MPVLCISCSFRESQGESSDRKYLLGGEMSKMRNHGKELAYEKELCQLSFAISLSLQGLDCAKGKAWEVKRVMLFL